MGEIIEVTALEDEEETIKDTIPRVQIGMNNFQIIISSKRIALIRTGKDYKALGHFFGEL